MPTACGASRQCCLCLDSGCSSVDGNTQGERGGEEGGEGEQGSANWDRRSGSGRKKEKGKGVEERQGVLKPSGGSLCLMMRLSRN